MTQIESGANVAPTSSSKPSSSVFRRIAVPVAVVVGAFGLLAAGIPWLIAETPHATMIRAGIVFLWILLGAFILAVPAAAIGFVWSWVALAFARRRSNRAGFLRALKCAVLSSSCLASLIVMEAVVRFMDHQSYRIPDPQLTQAKSPDGRDASLSAVGKAGAKLKILVLGESSAVGEPYQPWVSVGQVVGWKLESVFPDRTVEVDIQARGGFCLEQALLPLSHLDYKPDAIILFSGHNEFHARYGWARNVAHYAEEGPESLLGLQSLARSVTSTTHLIFKNLDRFYGEAPPPPHVSRELIDHPSFTPREYRYVLEEFHRRLDSLAAYCKRIGAISILIIPGSNDGAFEPSRSVLAGDTTLAERAEFATVFRAARSTEESDPGQAMVLYRQLIAQHPEFAEAHYRLGRLLVGTAKWNEAAQEFVKARDLDGLPVRCQSDFRAAFHSVASQYGSVLIDAPALVSKLSPHGIPDDHLYHDAHHMNLAGTVVVAQDVLDQLQARNACGWPARAQAPRIDLADCARHFHMDRKNWAKVCERSSDFYSRLAYVRYDPDDRVDVQQRYNRAAAALAASRPLDDTVPRSLTPLLRILEGLPAKSDAPRSP
jgi:hypothetical protein